MLNIKNNIKEELTTYPISIKDCVIMKKLEKGEKPSIVSDTMFKSMFYNEKRLKYSVKFLSYYLDISYEELLKNIKLTKNELDKDKEFDKGERSDYVAVIDDAIINIEVNNNPTSNILERNMEYAHRLYASSVKRGEKYKYHQVIQFNLNNFYYEGNNKIIDIYRIQNDEGILLNNKLIFIQIYIPNLRRKWYNEGIEGLTEEEKYILAMIEPSNVTSIEIGKDLSIVAEYLEECSEVTSDSGFGESYDKEWATKEWGKALGREEGIEEGKALGKEEGIEEGQIAAKKDIVLKMITKKLEIEAISDLTGISIDEINQVINSDLNKN